MGSFSSSELPRRSSVFFFKISSDTVPRGFHSEANERLVRALSLERILRPWRKRNPRALLFLFWTLSAPVGRLIDSIPTAERTRMSEVKKRPAPSVPPTVGEESGQPLWGGRLRIGEEVGRGAMGHVLRTYDKKLRRELALKGRRAPSRRDVARAPGSLRGRGADPCAARAPERGAGPRPRRLPRRARLLLDEARARTLARDRAREAERRATRGRSPSSVSGACSTSFSRSVRPWSTRMPAG